MLAPTFLRNSEIIRFNGTVFFTGDGSTSSATLLERHGNAISASKLKIVKAIHRTDWQGRVALSAAPRTNLLLQSGNAASWSLGGATLTAGSTYTLGNSTFASAVVASAGGAFQYAYSTFAATAGLTYILSALVVVGSSGTAQIGAVTTGANSVAIGVPGSMVAASSVLGVLTILSQTLLTGGIWLIKIAITPTLSDAAMRLAVGPRSATSGQNIIVLGGWVEQATTSGVYIPTTTAPVTVTDYTLTGASVACGQVPAGESSPGAGDAAVLDWDGVAKR